MKVTRKYFAVTAGNEIGMLRCIAIAGSLATTRKFCPSSLASRFFSGAPIPATIEAIKSGILGHEGDGANRLRLRKLVLNPRRFARSRESGVLVVFSRSPSVSMAKSGEPPLAVIFALQFLDRI